MKKEFKKLIFLLIFSISNYCYGNKIRLANGEWSPWLSVNMKHYGVASHIVTEAFNRIGYEVEYGFFPWKRGFEIAKNDWDGSIVWSFSEERGRYFYFSEPIISNETVLFHLKNRNFKWENYDDLKGMTIGTVLGYFYGKEFQEAIEKKVFNEKKSSSDIVNLKLLLNGQIDAVPCDSIACIDIARKNLPRKYKNLSFHPKPIRVVHYSLILNKANIGHEELINKFNNSLRKMREDGTYNRFLKDSTEGKYE